MCVCVCVCVCALYKGFINQWILTHITWFLSSTCMWRLQTSIYLTTLYHIHEASQAANNSMR